MIPKVVRLESNVYECSMLCYGETTANIIFRIVQTFISQLKLWPSEATLYFRIMLPKQNKSLEAHIMQI